MDAVAGFAVSVVVALALGLLAGRSSRASFFIRLQTFLPRQEKVSQPGGASVLWKTSPVEQVNGSDAPLCTTDLRRARCSATVAGSGLIGSLGCAAWAGTEGVVEGAELGFIAATH